MSRTGPKEPQLHIVVATMYTMYILRRWETAVADVTMVRKQLYITREQERALKDRARTQGLTEAEIVREALDRHLRHENRPAVPEDRLKRVDALIRMNKQVASQHRFPTRHRFSRDDLYAEREDRWVEHRDAK